MSDSRFDSSRTMIGRTPGTDFHRKSVWAYLPVGPLERQFVGGDPGGFCEKRSMRTFKKE